MTTRGASSMHALSQIAIEDINEWRGSNNSARQS